MNDLEFEGLVASAPPSARAALEAVLGDSANGVHLAVFVEPFLSYILDGSKTVESRFSRNFIPPHGRVHPGDVVLMKPSGKPIIGLCRVKHVWSYELDPASWNEVRSFSTALRADADFWEGRCDARYATLLRIEDVRRIGPVKCAKRDRRGWVVLKDKQDHGRLL